MNSDGNRQRQINELERRVKNLDEQAVLLIRLRATLDPSKEHERRAAIERRIDWVIGEVGKLRRVLIGYSDHHPAGGIEYTPTN